MARLVRIGLNAVRLPSMIDNACHRLVRPWLAPQPKVTGQKRVSMHLQPETVRHREIRASRGTVPNRPWESARIWSGPAGGRSRLARSGGDRIVPSVRRTGSGWISSNSSANCRCGSSICPPPTWTPQSRRLNAASSRRSISTGARCSSSAMTAICSTPTAGGVPKFRRCPHACRPGRASRGCSRSSGPASWCAFRAPTSCRTGSTARACFAST